jgi:hypothetical protein
VDDDGVLDEHGIRAVVGGFDLDDVPAGCGECRAVGRPLLDREVEVDG